MQLDPGQPCQAGECEPEVQSSLHVDGPADPVDAGRVHQQDQVLQAIAATAKQTDGQRQCRCVLPGHGVVKQTNALIRPPVERLLQCQQVLACQTVYPVPVVRDTARLADDLVEVGSEYGRDCLAAFRSEEHTFVVGRLAAPDAEPSTEEHTSDLQSLTRTPSSVSRLQK